MDQANQEVVHQVPATYELGLDIAAMARDETGITMLCETTCDLVGRRMMDGDPLSDDEARETSARVRDWCGRGLIGSLDDAGRMVEQLAEHVQILRRHPALHPALRQHLAVAGDTEFLAQFLNGLPIRAPARPSPAEAWDL